MASKTCKPQNLDNQAILCPFSHHTQNLNQIYTSYRSIKCRIRDGKRMLGMHTRTTTNYKCKPLAWYLLPQESLYILQNEKQYNFNLWQIVQYESRRSEIKHKKSKIIFYLTSILVTILRGLWSMVLLTFTSLIEQRNASGYKYNKAI